MKTNPGFKPVPVLEEGKKIPDPVTKVSSTETKKNLDTFSDDWSDIKDVGFGVSQNNQPTPKIEKNETSNTNCILFFIFLITIQYFF